MKTILNTLILTFLSITFYSQTLHFDSIPVPECFSFNLYEPGFAISNAGRMHYGGKDGAYYSDNNGLTWDTATYDWTGFTPINTVAVSPVSGNVYIGASNYGSFAMSTDSGKNFVRKTSTYCYSIFADDYGNVFAGLNGVMLRFKDGFYTNATPNKVLFGTVYAISTGEQGEMYAVTKKKIYMSKDTGKTWVEKIDNSSASRGEFTHVVAGANGDIFYGERYTSTFRTDTSFATSTGVGRPGLNSVKTNDGLIFVPNRFDQWGLSFDDGVTYTDYYTTSFNTLTAGVRVPRMSASEYPFHSLESYNNKIYFAGNNCQILVLSKGAATSIKEERNNKIISVYPNPLSNGEILNLRGIESNDRLVIRDVTGKEIARLNGITNIKIDSYKSGVYFLSVYSNEKTFTTKFIVK